MLKTSFFHTYPDIETARLVLRRLKMSDTELDQLEKKNKEIIAKTKGSKMVVNQQVKSELSMTSSTNYNDSVQQSSKQLRKTETFNVNKVFKKCDSSLNVKNMDFREVIHLPAKNAKMYSCGDFYVSTMKGGLKKVWIELIDIVVYIFENETKENLLDVLQLSTCFIKDNGSSLIKKEKYYSFSISYPYKMFTYNHLDKLTIKFWVESLRTCIGYRNFKDYYVITNEYAQLTVLRSW